MLVSTLKNMMAHDGVRLKNRQAEPNKGHILVRWLGSSALAKGCWIQCDLFLTVGMVIMRIAHRQNVEARQAVTVIA